MNMNPDPNFPEEPFNDTHGLRPSGGLLQTGDGLLYGTTSAGGDLGAGTIFRMTTAGVLTNLVSFDGTNGGNPYCTLMQANDGALYGFGIPSEPR